MNTFSKTLSMSDTHHFNDSSFGQSHISPDFHHPHQVPIESGNPMFESTPNFAHTADSVQNNSTTRRKRELFTTSFLEQFLASTRHLPPEELNKAKELLLRNIISEYRAARKDYRNNYLTMALHLLIPIFWPMLFGSQRSQRIQLEEARIRIQNALDVWKTELGPVKHRELTALLSAAAES